MRKNTLSRREDGTRDHFERDIDRKREKAARSSSQQVERLRETVRDQDQERQRPRENQVRKDELGRMARWLREIETEVREVQSRVLDDDGFT